MGMIAMPHTTGFRGTYTNTGSANRAESADAQRRLKRLAALANLMDSAISIPGTRLTIGLDPIIGLAPGIGDVVTSGISLYIVYEAWKIGATRSQLAAMLGNVLVDTLLGAVPIAGDLADFVFKANVRNLRILGITARGVKIEIDPTAPFRGRG